MSRRRERKEVMAGKAPSDGSPLGHLSDAELVREFARELARRRAGSAGLDLEAIESFAEGAQQQLGEETLAATVAALPPEGSVAKPCPRCGRPVPVKVHNRVRHILTTAGELRVSRNYHHCSACELGFYPRDRELGLPEEGEVSDAMERRILDFGRRRAPVPHCRQALAAQAHLHVEPRQPSSPAWRLYLIPHPIVEYDQIEECVEIPRGESESPERWNAPSTS